MPTLRPFRALRFDPAVVGDLSAVISPPYDVISPAERERLLARHPRNVVRIELPVVSPGSNAPGHADPYDQAARTLADWQRDGTLRTDPEPALYAYEATYRMGAADERLQRGFFARLRLEPLGGGVRPHEKTLSAPKEDRLRLLRATRVDTSPIVLLPDPDAGAIGEVLAGIAQDPPDLEATDDAGVRHRVWQVASGRPEATAMLAAGSRPITIADGHHRYETALRYRDEARGAGAAGDGPEGYVLALVVDVGSGDGPTILPTHRLLSGEASPQRELVRVVHGAFAADHRPSDTVVGEFVPPFRAPPGRIGVLLPRVAAMLSVEPARVEALFDRSTSAVVRSLDVAVLEAVLRPFLSEHPDVRLSYTHDAREAAAAVESDDALAAFLLSPTPIESVLAVAAAGESMPQKSTYFYPKVATGLVMYPLG